MKCKVCGEEVVLVPPAAERASKFGKTAKFYEELFPVHAECVLRQRTAETSRLMASLRERQVVKTQVASL